MLSNLASLLDSFRIPNRRRRGFNIFSRRRRRQTSSLRCQGIPGLSLQETLAHEPLEQRRLLAVDVALDSSGVLTVNFDDASHDVVDLQINSTGYSYNAIINGTENTSGSGVGTVAGLSVTDDGASNTSEFTLSDASQSLSEGLSISSEIDIASISSNVSTVNGAVVIDSPVLLLSGDIHSGAASQTYNGAVTLADDVTLATSTGVAGDLEIRFKGTVESQNSGEGPGPYGLTLESEAIHAEGDIGGLSALASFSAYSVNDAAERGQFYSSVTTDGLQSYKAGSSSGDVEFNGTYIAGGGIELLGEGTFGVVLSLAGDTSIDVGTDAFSVQKGSSTVNPGGNIVSQGEPANLTITAGNITVPAGIGAGSSLSSPELKDFTINGIGTVGLNTPEVITSGDFTANPAIKIYQDTKLLSGNGSINLSGGLNNGSKALTLGDSAQTGSVFVGGLQVRHLEVGDGAFDVTLDGAMHLATNLAEPTKFLNTGSLTLIGQGSSFFGGVEALSVSQTNIAGCVSTFGHNINLSNVTMLDSTYAARFDTRWTQTQGGTAGGGNITISNFNTGNLNATKSVEFDIGNGTHDTVLLTGNIVSNNELRFKGNGSVDVTGEASLAGSVRALDLSHEPNTTPSLNFTGNVTLTGPMEFEGTSATFTNGVEGNGNDLTLNFSQAATVDGYSNVANFTSEGDVDLSGNFTTSGFQKYEGNVALVGNTKLVATTVEFADGVTGNSHNLTLSPTSSSITLDGINLSGVNELTIGGDLDLAGDLYAENIDIQGDTTLLGDANVTANGTVFVPNYAAPTLAGSLTLGDFANDVALSSDGLHAFVASDDGLSIIDVSNVAVPTLAGSLALSGQASGVALSSDGQHAFVSVNDGLKIINVSNVAVPTLAGHLTSSDESSDGDDPSGVALSSDGLHAFVASDDGLKIIDVSDVAVPTLAGHLTLSGSAYIVALSSDGQHAFVSVDDGLKIINVSNVAVPTLAGHQTLSGSPLGVALSSDGQHAFVSVDDGLKIINVSNVAVPTLAGHLTSSDDPSGVALSSDGLHAFVASDDGLSIIDVSNVAVPTLAGSLTLSGQASGVALSSDGQHAFVSVDDGSPVLKIISLGSEEPGSVNFGGTVDGVYSLSTDGPTSFAGVVGGTHPLASLTTRVGNVSLGANVTTTGDQTFGTTVTILSDTTFSGGNISLSGFEGGGHNVEFDFADTEIDAGAQSFVNIVNLNVTGTSTLNGTIQTTGNQVFQGKAELDGDTTLLSGDGSINLAGGVGGGSSGSKTLTLGDSAQTGSIFVGGLVVKTLEVGDGAFDVTLDGAMHLATNLPAPTKFLNTGSLTLKGQGSSFFGGVEALSVSQTNIAGCVSTFGHNINLNNVTMLDSTYTARFDTRWTQTQGGTAGGGNITISNFNTGNLNATKSVEFDIGNGTHDTVLLTGNIVSNNELRFKGNGSVDVTGEASLAGSVRALDLSHEPNTTPSLNFTGNVTLTGPMEFEGTSATFANGVEGKNNGQNNDLTLDFSQTATVDGYSNIANFTSKGAVNLSGDFNTSGFQKYEGNVALGGNTELVATTVEFNNGVTGNLKNLTLSPSDSFMKLDGIQLSGVETLTIDGNLSLSGNLSAGDIDIQGNTTLIGDANLTSEIVSCVSSLQITLNGTVDGGHALSVNGATTFDGEIGGTTPLASLTTEGGDTSLGGNVTTTGNQTFGSDVTLTGDTKFVSGNLFDLSGLVGGGHNVEIDAENTIIDAQKHSVSGIADLTVPGELGLNGSIATTGSQSYGGDVGVIGNTTLTAGSGAISLGTGGKVIGLGLDHTLTLGDASQTGDVTLSGNVSLDGLEVGQGAFNLRVNTSQFTVTKLVDILSTGTLEINPVGNSQLNFVSGLNATNPSSINLAGAIASSQGPGDLVFGYVKVGYASQNATLTVGGNENAVISFNTLEINGGKLNYDGPVDIEDLNITNAGGAADVGINGTGYFHVSGDASVTGNVSSGGNLSDGGAQEYDGNVTLTGTAGFVGKSADFQKGVTGNNNDLTLGFTEQSTLDGLDNVQNFTSSGEILLNGSFETNGFQNFAGGINLAADTTLHAASGFIKLDGIQGENYELTIGNTSAPSALEADLTIEGDVNLNSLNATSGNYNASLIGSPMKFQQVTLLNSGDVTLGQNDTTDLVVEDGIVVDKASATFVAGTIASDGAGITLHNISLNANTTIDTTNGGSNPTGAEILLKESITFNGHTLKTDGGTSDTDFRGDMTLKNGTLDVTKGNVNFGESGNLSNAANIIIAEQMTINVPESGALNVFDGSKVDAGTFPINIKANTINFESTAGSFISKNEITIVPATVGNNISVGSATGDGLTISQTTFNKMQAPNLVIGGAGYTGTITVENLNSTNSGQLTLIANGTGGAIDISGGLELQGQDLSGISLIVKGSGATTDLNGTITTAGAAFFDDAVRLVGDTSIVTSGGDVTITGGTDGIYSQSGSNHNLSINAGAGDIVVGNQAGFGNNGGSDALIGKVTLDSTSSITLGEGDQEMHSLDVFNSPLELGGGDGTSLILSGGLFGGADLRTGITGNKNFLEIDLQSGFVDIVKLGSITNVNNLAITEDSLSPSPLRKVEMHGDVTTVEGQTYEPTIELRGDVDLIAGGDVSINGKLTAFGLGTRSLDIDTTSGTVSIADFGVSLDESQYDVGVVRADNVDLGGGANDDVGGLNNLSISGITDSVNFTSTSGLELHGNLSVVSPNVNIGSGSTVETFGDLTINSTNKVSLGGDVRTYNSGNIAINSPDISLGADVIADSFSGGTLTLNGTASVTESIILGSGGDLTVTGALLATANATHDIAINSFSTAKIGGVVGSGNPASGLAFRNLTTDEFGTTEFSANIAAAYQTFNDDLVFTNSLTASGLDVTFDGTVDADDSSIVLDFTNTAKIDGSSWSNLAALTVNAGTIGLAGTIESSGSQTYNGAVQLNMDDSAGDVALRGFSLTIPGAINGPDNDYPNFLIDFEDTTAPTSLFGFNKISNFVSESDVSLDGTFTNDGTQTFNGNVSLAGDTVLSSESGVGAVVWNGVDGNSNDLSLNFATVTAIDSTYQNLKNLTVNSDASLTGTISTSGFQDYNGTTTLLGNTALSATSNVRFGDTLDGSHDLSIEADSGRIDFFGALGSSAPLRSLNLESATAVEATAPLTIDGAGGSGPGLRVGPNVDNININTTSDSVIRNASQDGILFYGGSANSTLGNFSIENSGGSGVVALAGNYTGSTFANSTVGGSGESGLVTVNADGFTVNNNTFVANANHGIRFDAAKNSVAQNNVVGNNGLYGVLVVTSDEFGSTSNISVDNNFIGMNGSGSDDIAPNGRSGIWILGNAPGHGTVDTVSITGNTIANNAVHGIEVWGATNVHIGGRRGDPSENTITNNAQYGIAFTDTVTGSKVTGNTLVGNAEAGLFLNNAQGMQVGGGVDGASSLDISESDFGVVAGGDLSNTHVIGNTIHENVRAGFQLLSATNFQIFRNTIEENGAYGVLALGESDGSRVYGNTISRQEAGVWLAGASGMTIGSLNGSSSGPLIGNRIEENSSVGIIIQGEDSFNNVILSNQIDTNIYFGIQFVQGATTVAVPRLTSVTTSQVTGVILGDEGDVYRIQFFYTPLAQAEDGRHAQGEYLLGYEDVTIGSDGAATVELDVSSSQMVAGDIVTATATSMVDGSPTQSSSFSQGRRAREALGNTP